MGRIELFTTSTAATLQLKSDIMRLKALLDAKKVPYEEVDLAEEPSRREAMLRQSNGNKSLPQLHSNGKFIGGLAAVQELEDFGELMDAIKNA